MTQFTAMTFDEDKFAEALAANLSLAIVYKLQDVIRNQTDFSRVVEHPADPTYIQKPTDWTGRLATEIEYTVSGLEGRVLVQAEYASDLEEGKYGSEAWEPFFERDSQGHFTRTLTPLGDWAVYKMGWPLRSDGVGIVTPGYGVRFGMRTPKRRPYAELAVIEVTEDDMGEVIAQSVSNALG